MEKELQQPRISDEYKQTLLKAIQHDSDSAYGGEEELTMASENDQKRADDLQALHLNNNDWEANIQDTNPYGDFRSDIKLIQDTFDAEDEVDLIDKSEILKHSFLLGRGTDEMLHVKTMNLQEWVSKEDSDQIHSKRIPDSTFWVGKCIFEEGSSKYIDLTDEDRKQIDQFIQDEKIQQDIRNDVNSLVHFS